MTVDIRCPKCSSENVIFSKKRGVNFCEDCEYEFAFAPLRIFLSYGHDSNEELVRQIKADLEKRGHTVWIDRAEIKGGQDWRRSITDGILTSNRVLSFLSKHSTRDPGVCRDEIAIAIAVKGGNIETILVESEQEVQPPVNISHIQWLDMHDWREQRVADNAPTWETWAWYRAKLAEILRVVESDESRRFAGEIDTLNSYLKPINSDTRICQLLDKVFFGRQWLFEAVEKWRQTERGSRLFWIVGAPGVGKSAFAARLTHTKGDIVIAAQFCEWDKPDHRNAGRVVRSIAFQLATRLPDYRKFLIGLPEIREDHLDRKTPSELFTYLLADPLQHAIDGGRGRYLIVIDALDEAGSNGRNELVEMLARNAHRLPEWIGIVVTSRPESEVIAPLQGLNPSVLDTATEPNRADIRNYLWYELAANLQNRPDADRLVEQILEKSEGVFLYIEHFCDDVHRGRVSLDLPEEFPQGLGGIFFQYFKRQFRNLKNFRKVVRPALRAILAARDPLPVEILQGLFSWQDEELRDFTGSLSSIFPVMIQAGQEVIKPYHKSLADWVTNKDKAGAYFVSLMEGHQMLAKFCWEDYGRGPRKMSLYALRHLPAYLLAAERTNELTVILTDLNFVGAKCEAGMARDLAADYSTAGAGRGRLKAPVRTLRVHEGNHGLWCPWCLAWTQVSPEALGSDVSCVACGSAIHINQFVLSGVWQPSDPARTPFRRPLPPSPAMPQAVHEFADFVFSEVNTLASRPSLTFQQAHNQPNGSAPQIAAESLRQVAAEPRVWLRWGNKPQTADPCLMTVSGQYGSLFACAGSPDGTLLAAVASDHSIKLWDARSGTELINLVAYDALVPCCTFSPDGRQVASGTSSGALHIWNVETGLNVIRMDCSAGAVGACAFAPDGERIVAGYQDGTVRIWDVQSGAALATLDGHEDSVSAVTYSPDCVSVVTASTDRKLVVWDGQNGRKIAELTGHARAVTSAAFGPDGSTLVSGSEDCTLRIWNTDEWKHLATLTGNRGAVRGVAYSPDAQSIVSGTYDGTLTVWDAEALVELARLEGHIGAVNGCVYSADGRRIVSASSDGTVRVWDATGSSGSQEASGHTGTIRASGWTSDGEIVLTGSDDRTIRAWSPHTGQMVGLFPTAGPIQSLATAQAGNGVVAANSDGGVYHLSLDAFGPDSPELVAVADTEVSSIPPGVSESRTIRVIINSTFADMKEERDILHRRVFPQIRTLCKQHGAEFEPVDLRWGIRDEEALDHSTLTVALDQVHRCADLGGRGMAICLLGDLYGWVPPPTTIRRDVFEMILAKSQPEERLILGSWYRCDYNAVPPEYRLLQRTGDYVKADRWGMIEERLKAIMSLSLGGETGALVAGEWLGVSATELEIRETLQSMNRNRIFCYIRSSAELPPARDKRLANLEQTIRTHLPREQVHDYHARWRGEEDGLAGDHLERLCNQVEADLRSAILDEIRAWEMIPPLEHEIEAHRIFGLQRQRNMFGFAESVDSVHSRMQSDSGHPVVLVGRPGSDVSGQAAAYIAQLTREPQAAVVYRFIGATPQSTDVRALLEGLCGQIGNIYGYDQPLPQRYSELVRLLPRLLKMATAGRPLRVIVGSLDLLNSGHTASALSWLPVEIPPYVGILVSMTIGDDEEGCYSEARARLPEDAFITAKIMSQADASEILDGWLREAGRTLQRPQRDVILNGFRQNGLPLYFRIAFLDIARALTSFDPPPVIPPDVRGMISMALDRLEKRHGFAIVSRTMGYIAASRRGLTQEELIQVLSHDDEVWADFASHSRYDADRRLPAIVWARLKKDFDIYLTDRNVDGLTVIHFLHRQVTELVNERYLSIDCRSLHIQLARYYLQQPAEFEHGSATMMPNSRRLSEVAFQLARAEAWQELESVLTDLTFIELKCRAGMVSDLLTDYDSGLRCLPKSPLSESLSGLSDFVGSQLPVFRRYPQLVVQQARNQPEDSATQTALATLSSSGADRRPCVRWLNKPTARSACRLSLDGHVGAVTTCRFAPDGHHVASTSLDGTLRIWDAYTGWEYLVVTGRGGWMTTCAFSPNGRWLVSGAADGTLTLWDTTGNRKRTFAGHSGEVTGCCWSLDGTQIASASKDGTVRVWDASGQNGVVVGADGKSEFNDCCWSPDGQFIVAALQDGRLMLFGATGGSPQLTLRGHLGPVLACAYAPDGRHIVSASEDQTLRIWDAETGSALRCLTGHTGPVVSCAFLPDGRRLVSGDCNGVIALWDLDSAAALGGATAHSGSVRSCATSVDGCRIITGGDDGLLRIWDVEALARIGKLPQPDAPIKVVAYSPDGEWVAAVSNEGGLQVISTGNFETREIARTSEPAGTCTFSPDGRYIACGGPDGEVTLRDNRSGAVVNEVGIDGGSVTSCAFSPDGKKLATGSADHTLHITDITGGAAPLVLAGHSGTVTACAYRRDGRILASGATDGSVRLWDTGNGSETACFVAIGGIETMAMSPDGHTVAAAGSRGLPYFLHLEGRGSRMDGHQDAGN